MKSVGIIDIWQKDNVTFCIKWSDEIVTEYRLSDLQRQCPCAACVDEKSGQRLNKVVNDDVQARQIVNVGRYALRIQFTEGCSNGIFSFDELRKR